MEFVTFDKWHTHFGGIVYPSDFCGSHHNRRNRNGSEIARRIERDFWRDKALLREKMRKDR